MATLLEIDAEIARRQQASNQGGQPSLAAIDAEIASRQNAAPQDFSVSETIQNIPSSAAQLGRDIIEPILSPVETAKSIGALGQGVIEKGVKNIAAAVPEEVPVIGPIAAGINLDVSENEEIANSVGDFINERYGSVDAFKATVQEDPVGALSDIAGLLAGGSLMLPKAGKLGAIGRAAETVGKAVDPLNISVSAVKAAAKGSKVGRLIPQALPEKLLESALKFRPSIKPSQRANMTKTALAQGIMPTVDGLQKITDKLDGLNTSLDKIIDAATASGETIPKKAIFVKLKQLRKDLGGAKVDASTDLRVIDRMAKQFNENLKRINKDRLTPRELQDLKTDAYKRINFDITQGGAGFAKQEARKAIAKGAKESLEAIDPSVKPINREMGDLLELNKELERVVSRLDNRNLIGLDTAAKVGAGAATGTPLGTAAGATAAVFGNPRVKARSALILENIRKNAETIEVIKNKLPPVLARSLLEQTGRLNESLGEQIDKEE
jgi:hypothetical protein